MVKETEFLLENIEWTRNKVLASIAICRLDDSIDKQELFRAEEYLRAGFAAFKRAVRNEAAVRKE